MRTMAILNDDVAYDLGLSFESLYIIGYLHSIRNTDLVETKIINDEEWFTFSLVNLFKRRKLVFEQVNIQNNVTDEEKEAYIEKIYNKNKSRFNRLLKGDLSKVLIRGKNIKVNGGSKTYYKFNKSVLTPLINGYPKIIDTELTDNEKVLSEATGIVSIPKNIRTQLKNMDNEVLIESIEIAKNKDVLDFPYIKKVYNNLLAKKKADTVAPVPTNQTDNKNIDTDSIPQNKKNDTKNIKNNNSNYKKTKFHNCCNESFDNYEDEEIVEMATRGQRDKFKENENKETDLYSKAYMNVVKEYGEEAVKGMADFVLEIEIDRQLKKLRK